MLRSPRITFLRAIAAPAYACARHPPRIPGDRRDLVATKTQVAQHPVVETGERLPHRPGATIPLPSCDGLRRESADRAHDVDQGGARTSADGHAKMRAVHGQSRMIYFGEKSHDRISPSLSM